LHLSLQVPETHSKIYTVIQNTYCYDNGLNSQCSDLTPEILRMQEWLDPGVRLNVEQNQSHGLHKTSFMVQVTNFCNSHEKNVWKIYWAW